MKTIEPTLPRINQPRYTEPTEPVPVREFDPLRLCIFTTIALIAWVATPPVAVAFFATLGLRGYYRARKAGLLRSRCLLGDTRLVMAYLAMALVVGVGYTVWRLLA